MPNTKITKQKWKDHYSYAKKVYLIGIICAIAITSLIFSVTRYVPSNEHAVLIELVDAYVDTTKLEADQALLLEAGRQYDDTLEQVQFFSISYTGKGDTENDYYGSQLYMVQVYAGDNDIYLQNELLTQGMIDQGYCIPLETLSGFEAFAEKYPETIVYQTEPDPDADEDEEEESDEPNDRPVHAYAIDVSNLRGLAERGAYDMSEKYAVIVLTSENADTSFRVFTEMFELYYVQPDTTAAPATPSEAQADAPAEAEDASE